MNTQEKEKILKKFIGQIQHFQKQMAQSEQKPPAQFSNYIPPDIDIVTDLINHQKQITRTVDGTFNSVKVVLSELSQLQTRKQNINKLLDSMTSIKEIKRLSFGLGSNSGQIYRNLISYYQIKEKAFFCDKYIEKVEEEIKKIKQNCQSELQSQLKKTDSQNITEIAKIITLINEKSNLGIPHTTNSNQLIRFYVQMVKKQLKVFEQDLLKIPMNASNTSNSYVFFEIIKQVLKLIVNTCTNYKSNIIKIGGEEGLQQAIIEIFSVAMNGIILEIFMREKKYFDVQAMDPKKINKEQNKFRDYLNEFCAIWNQIQRLRLHLLNEIPLFSQSYKRFQNNLSNSINTKELITINSQVYEGFKNYTRFQINNMLKISPFVNSISQTEQKFLVKVIDSFTKGQKQFYEANEGQTFILELFSLIIKNLEKAFSSLNMLIISPFITFANNHLIQQDTFYVFVQLFNRNIGKITTGESKFFVTAVILVINTTLLMPHAFKTEISSFKIPTELETYKNRLQSQLKQLAQVCQFKTKQVINNFIEGIISSNWFKIQIKQDYKKTLDKWKGFSSEATQIFLIKASKLHASIILSEQFNPRVLKKVVTQQGIINLEKEVRSIITFYEIKGCSALNSFKKVLQYIEIMLSEDTESSYKLMKKFGIIDKQETQTIQQLISMKVH